MKHPSLRAQRLRFTLAFAATGFAIDICAYQRHFTLSPLHPSSYGVMLHHKCGILFVLCFTWLAIELAGIAAGFPRRAFHQARF